MVPFDHSLDITNGWHCLSQPCDVFILNKMLLFTTAKLTDFGISVKKGDKLKGGTLKFIPPEVLGGKTKIADTAFDVYGLG